MHSSRFRRAVPRDRGLQRRAQAGGRRRHATTTAGDPTPLPQPHGSEHDRRRRRRARHRQPPERRRRRRRRPRREHATQARPPRAPGPSAPGDVKIVELMIASQSGAGDRGEWVELQSTRSCILNLNGLVVQSPRGTSTDKATVATDVLHPARRLVRRRRLRERDRQPQPPERRRSSRRGTRTTSSRTAATRSTSTPGRRSIDTLTYPAFTLTYGPLDRLPRRLRVERSRLMVALERVVQRVVQPVRRHAWGGQHRRHLLLEARFDREKDPFRQPRLPEEPRRQRGHARRRDA